VYLFKSGPLKNYAADQVRPSKKIHVPINRVTVTACF